MSNLDGIDIKHIPAYILAAGRGSRLYPFSQILSKPLLPIINIPIILHSIEQLLLAGIKQISVIIKPQEQKIQEVLRKTYPQLNFDYIIQKEPLGTGHAVLQVEKHVVSNNFIVLAGDSLFTRETVENLAKTHMNEKNFITLALEEMEFEQMQNSSTVDFRDGRVWDILEKPQTKDEIMSNLNSAALYMFRPEIFDIIRKTPKTHRGEYELPSAIKETLSHNKRVGGTIVSRIYHISNAHDLWKINLFFLKNLKSKDMNGNLLGKEVEISTPNQVKNSVIGDFCSIKSGIKVENSVVLPYSIIKQHIRNSLVLSDHVASFMNE
jgi:glucose-1-phosphate thymidylyltransferase